MSEVINIRTGEAWQAVPKVDAPIKSTTRSLVGRIIDSFASNKNDKVRRTTALANIKAHSSFKEAMCSDDGTLLRNLYHKFTTSKFDEISFGTISEDLFSQNEKALSKQLHSAGLIHLTDNSNMSVVWKIDQNTYEISFQLATEYFEKIP